MTKNVFVEPTREEWEKLLLLSKEFHKNKPWLSLETNYFTIENPENGEFALCQLMGSNNQEFGILLFKNSDYFGALEQYFDMIEQAQNPGFMYCYDGLILSYENREDLSKKDLDLIKNSEVKFRGKNAWPVFRSLANGMYPWDISSEEARFLYNVLEQTMILQQEYEKDKKIIGKDNNLVRYFDKNEKVWKNKYFDLSQPRPEEERNKIELNDIAVQKIKKDAKKIGEWAIDVFFIPEATQSEDGERPFFPYVMFIVDVKSGMILGQTLTKVQKGEEDFNDYLLELFEQTQKYPKVISFIDYEVEDLFGDLADALDISLKHKKSIPLLEDARNEFFKVQDKPSADLVFEVLQQVTGITDPEELMQYLESVPQEEIMKMIMGAGDLDID